MSRALTRSATLALIAALSGTAFAQETKPEDSNAPKPAEPAPPPADQATPPPTEAPPSVPAPAPYTSSQVDVGLTPVGNEPAVRKNRLIFLAGLGYTAGGAVKHPDLQGDKFTGEMLELGFGTELAPQWRLVLAFSSFQTTLERVAGTNQFKNTSGAVYGGAGFHPLAGCADCMTNGGQGGIVVRQPFHIHTLGPRLDYLPFGDQGLFFGVTAGAALMQDLDFRGGFAAAARAGLEWRPYKVFGISVEAGAHGQVYSDSSAVLPYASAQLRLMAEPPPLSTTTTVPANQQPYIVHPPPANVTQ
jgi:hypothetical protein